MLLVESAILILSGDQGRQLLFHLGILEVCSFSEVLSQLWCGELSIVPSYEEPSYLEISRFLLISLNNSVILSVKFNLKWNSLFFVVKSLYHINISNSLANAVSIYTTLK